MWMQSERGNIPLRITLGLTAFTSINLTDSSYFYFYSDENKPAISQIDISPTPNVSDQRAETVTGKSNLKVIRRSDDRWRVGLMTAVRRQQQEAVLL